MHSSDLIVVVMPLNLMYHLMPLCVKGRAIEYFVETFMLASQSSVSFVKLAEPVYTLSLFFQVTK